MGWAMLDWSEPRHGTKINWAVNFMPAYCALGCLGPLPTLYLIVITHEGFTCINMEIYLLSYMLSFICLPDLLELFPIVIGNAGWGFMLNPSVHNLCLFLLRDLRMSKCLFIYIFWCCHHRWQVSNFLSCCPLKGLMQKTLKAYGISSDCSISYWEFDKGLI